MDSFEQLVKQYEPMIHKIIRLLHIYKNEDEFFQIGAIALWEASVRFDVEKGNFTSYAFSYIKGKILTELTKARVQEERSIYPKEEFWELIEDEYCEQPFELKQILTYCESLTENQKKWVLYTVFDGLSITEIARKEGVSPSAVKAWRKGAKERLRCLAPPE